MESGRKLLLAFIVGCLLLLIGILGYSFVAGNEGATTTIEWLKIMATSLVVIVIMGIVVGVAYYLGKNQESPPPES